MINGKQFRMRFITTESAGFAFGLPVALAYALLLIQFENSSAGSAVIRIALLAGLVIVAFIAMPINFILTRPLLGGLDKLSKDALPADEGQALFLRLTRLPLIHGLGIFIRISGGAIFIAAYMHFSLGEPVYRCFIAFFFALYGAFLAGLLGYVLANRLISPIARTLVEQGAVGDETISKRKFFGLSTTVKVVLFLVVPVVFTNFIIYLSLSGSASAASIVFSALLNKILAVGLVNILTLLVASLLVLTSFNGPVRELQETLEEFRKAGTSRKTLVRTDLSDNLAYIAFLINKTIDNFRLLLVEVAEAGRHVNASIQDLSAASQEIASTSHEQAASVKEIVSTMEDSDKLSKSVAIKIQEVSRIATSTKDTVNGGFGIIQESLQKMEDIRSSNTETINGIRSLGDKIDSIWEIVNIINDIADQTKIIAFNAELEASAAGEAGKNFQIVATEIRRLADSTVTSTSKIKGKINEIQHSSDNLIIASEQGTEKISQGWKLSHNLRSVFEDILSSAEITASQAGQISISVNQQASAVEQILLTLKQISEGIDAFVTSTRATTMSSETLRQMSGKLDKLLRRYQGAASAEAAGQSASSED